MPAGAGDPRLTLRFALYAAIALVGAMAATFFFARREAIGHAEQNGRYHTQFVADAILRDRLRASDFDGPVTGVRRAQLDALAGNELMQGGAVRANLYGTDGRIVYSTDHALIGDKPDEDDALEALHGESSSDVTNLGAEDGQPGGVKVLENYVPVTLPRSPRANGVFELYQDYAPIASSARETFVPIALGVALVLLLLYLSFFPILRRATARLRRQMEQIEHQAFHDALTALPNRALFHDRVEQALRGARRNGTTVAVMVMDLDRFKEVNDTLGHQSGDELLVEVGGRLRDPLRESDTVARLGGDEFGVLAPSVASADDALVLAQRLRDALERPHRVAGVEVDVDAAVGIALFPRDGRDVATLMRRADIAMYVSKETHAPALYAPEHDSYSSQRLALIAQLRRAIAQREITVYYQPQADVRSGRVRSVEALVRWEHPEHGLLPPDRFIPLAEHTGLIRALTSHVLDIALAQCASWRERGIDLGVAVNITGRDLLDLRLPDEVDELLRRWQVAPERLELEITENTVLTDPIRARQVLVRLSELGVRLAIDDFGSGNSSLGYLKRLPVDVLKIDKSFVLNMDESDDDAVIVRSTIDLGHNLGLRVVAEGVETLGTLGQLEQLGCDVAQGYWLSRPVPPEEVERLLADADAAAPDAARPGAA
ncbi:MAG TPA: EAL domain-containing protein [Conexibacter sp.]|nr:EAL domain-containing protein [Conexibacter sp.]